MLDLAKSPAINKKLWKSHLKSRGELNIFGGWFGTSSWDVIMISNMSRLSFEINKLRIGSIWSSYLALHLLPQFHPISGFQRSTWQPILPFVMILEPSASYVSWSVRGLLLVQHELFKRLTERLRGTISLNWFWFRSFSFWSVGPKNQFSNQQTSINQHVFTPNLNQHNSPTISGIQDASGFLSLWGSPNKSTHRSLTFVSRYIGIHAEGSNQTPNVFGQLLQVLRYIPGRV